MNLPKLPAIIAVLPARYLVNASC